MKCLKSDENYDYSHTPTFCAAAWVLFISSNFSYTWSNLLFKTLNVHNILIYIPKQKIFSRTQNKFLFTSLSFRSSIFRYEKNTQQIVSQNLDKDVKCVNENIPDDFHQPSKAGVTVIASSARKRSVKSL